MLFTQHAGIGAAATIPVPDAEPIVVYSPLVLKTTNRRVDLQLRVTAPASVEKNSNGKELPILLLSHGHGRSDWLSSQQGYAPLVEFYAGHGFVVLQPTHLSSRALGLELNGDSIRELFLESRVQDMSTLLDRLDEIEDGVPFLRRGQLDRARVAVAGHSLGGITASVLLGAVNTDPRDGHVTNAVDTRIKAGAIIGGPGSAGTNQSDLSDNGKVLLPLYDPDFSTMATPALVAWGDEDGGPHLTVRGADWHNDPYTLAPAPKVSLTIKGGKHGFGGISGWDAGETQDGSPERLGTVQRLTWAYLWSQLYPEDRAWAEASAALQGLADLARVESK
ncbi:hypothetical protein HMPREF1624_05110 [Sporothrix schenckii ATCC 58251]|uniref:1-alkyl-2-acetylglycerophosphocholine esterase n=2 Tax=Sporothrix schenckii TaxID=29908 RepID=U7PTP2_SPOS1|nr:hypothetical protein HMPREF1624_05110 [Sporothrix schenckii ATCC 58251]